MTRISFLIIGVLSICAGCVSAPTATGPVPNATDVAQTAPARSFLALINAERAAQGRGGVTADPVLARAAEAHAADMVAQNYFSHTGSDGSRFTVRARRVGYGCAIAENIAFGQTNEAQVFDMWLNSSGHRRNMLLEGATEYGLGRSANHWVLMMGTGC